MRRLANGAVVAVVLLSLSARPAQASGHTTSGLEAVSPLFAILLVIGLVGPSDLGAEIPAHDPGDGTQFVLGWSWQIPIPLTRNGEPSGSNHHFIGGFDYLPQSSDGHFIGRFGYRYDRSRLIAGLTAAFGHTRGDWSPEIGVKLIHLFEPYPPLDPSLHLLARANIAFGLDRFDGVTVLLGWSFF